MKEVTLLNLKNNKSFTRVYDNFEELRKFLIKCSYSTKVKVISVFGLSIEEQQELAGINY